MGVDFRFDSESRGARVTLAVCTVALTWLMVLLEMPVRGILMLLLRPLDALGTLRWLANEMIALHWYTCEIIKINWKD